MVSNSFSDRPLKKLCLFDVHGTLISARHVSLSKVEYPRPLITFLWAGCIAANDRNSAQTEEEAANHVGPAAIPVTLLGL